MQQDATVRKSGFGGPHAGSEIQIPADHPMNSSELIGLMTVTAADLPALSKLVLSQSAVAAAIKLATAGLGYVMFVVLAWAMEPAQYGQYAVGFNFAIVLSAVAGLGATTAILRFMPQYRVQGRSDLARGVLVEGILLTFAASFILALVVAFAPAMPFLSGHSAINALAASALLIPAFALSEYVSCALRANSVTFWALVPRDIFWRSGVIVLALLAVGWGWHVSAAAGLLATAFLLLAIVALQSLLVLPLAFEGPRDVSHRREWYRTTMPMWASGVLFAMTQQLDVVVAAAFTSLEDAGAYFAAQKTASLLSLMPIAVGLVGASTIASHYHAGDMEGLRRLCSRMSLIITIPTLASFLGLAIAGSWLLELFDPSFGGAYGILMILGFGALLGGLAGPTAYFLQMTGRERDYLKIMFLSYCLTLILQLVLGYHLGTNGIALGTTIGLAVLNIWPLFVIRRDFGVDTSVIGLLTGRKA
jgi:O-antigen/teichoic acid export membrane protein